MKWPEAKAERHGTDFILPVNKTNKEEKNMYTDGIKIYPSRIMYS